MIHVDITTSAVLTRTVCRVYVSALMAINTINGAKNVFYETVILTLTVRPITALTTTTIIRFALMANVIAKNNTERNTLGQWPYVRGICRGKCVCNTNYKENSSNGYKWEYNFNTGFGSWLWSVIARVVPNSFLSSVLPEFPGIFPGVAGNGT